jgi:competence protein ComEA
MRGPASRGRWRGFGTAVMLTLVSMLMLGPTTTASGAGRGQSLAQAPGSQDPLPDAPEKETFVATCGVCHEVDTAIGTRRTTADWQLVIDAMINRGALGTDDEFKAILGYLTRHFVIVNVNAAGAAEIAKVLELTPATAEALVAYRREHGAFASLDDVKRVPGIESGTIEDLKPRIAFK